MKRGRFYLTPMLLLAVGLTYWWGKRADIPQVNQNFSPNLDVGRGKAYPKTIVNNFLDIMNSSDASAAKNVYDMLAIPSADVSALSLIDEEQMASRVNTTEDSILAAGGLGQVKLGASDASEEVRSRRLKSILAEDWDGKANLLVNELRAADGFEVTLESVEAFLRGKNLFGWPEGTRNWIGDEMMTMLRQEIPQQAYQTFSSIQADAMAPAAMRDYSIQHISHLIADGHVGGEGVAVIRAAYESGNPVLAGTALISLHRLSEKSSDLITVADVRHYAEQSKGSQDERLKITAQAILQEVD